MSDQKPSFAQSLQERRHSEELRARRNFLVDKAQDMREDMTRAEQLLADRLDALDDIHMYPQLVVEGYIVDFAHLHSRVAVELDGSTHLGRADYDAARTRALTSAGWYVMRFTNERVTQHTDQVIAEIEEAIHWRAQERPRLVIQETEQDFDDVWGIGGRQA